MDDLRDERHQVQTLSSAFACQTCRHRRVKCDKQKPHCTPCKKGSRQCDWDEENYINTSRRFIMHPMPKAPTSAPDLSGPEKRALHYFRCRAASQLAAPFNSDLWGDWLFRLAEQQNFLQYALTALSTMHESYTLTSDARQQRRDEAIRFHNKAMRHISRRSESEVSPEAVLLAIIIFHSFDSLRGCAQQALQHVLSGLKIIQGHEASRAPKVHQAITDTFVALQNQVREFSNMHMSKAFDTTRDYQPRCIEEFPSLHVAHTQLEIIYNELYGIIDYCYSLQEAHVDLHGVFATDIQPRLHAVAAHFECWQRGLAKMETDASRDSAACLLLRMYESFISLILDSFPASLTFDTYTPDIAAVLDLAARFLQAEEQTREGQRPFSPSLGVIPVLFIFAWRSNCTEVRDRSLQLLRQANRREGIWDTKLALQMAEKAIAFKTQLGVYEEGSGAHAELSEINFESDSSCWLTYTAVGGDVIGLPGERLPPIGSIGDYRTRERITVVVE